MTTSAVSWPTEIRLSKERTTLVVVFENADTVTLRAEYLRVKSPSAEVRGHSEAERKTVGGKRNVAIRAVDPVGNYAIRITFDDGHDSGLFTWDLLHTLGKDEAAIWQQYLDELEAKGLSRDKPGIR